MWPGKLWLRILVWVVGRQVLFIKIVTLKACQVFRAALPITRLECWGFRDGMISSLCSLHSSISLIGCGSYAPRYGADHCGHLSGGHRCCFSKAEFMNCVYELGALVHLDFKGWSGDLWHSGRRLSQD